MCSSDDQPHHCSRKRNDSNQGKETGGDDLPTQPVTRSQTRQQKNSCGCFLCGGTRHFARDYPLCGCGAPVEALLRARRVAHHPPRRAQVLACSNLVRRKSLTVNLHIQRVSHQRIQFRKLLEKLSIGYVETRPSCCN